MAEMRTLTYVVKMDTADGKKAAKDFRVTLKTMNQDAGKAGQSVNDLAKSLGDKYGVSAKAAVVETSALTNELRQTVKDANQAERAFTKLSSEYKHLIARTGQTAERQEQLNALHRLGANATQEQKDEILRLVAAQQAQVKASANTQGSMRNLRGQAQNLGWQLQDVSVQYQMLGFNAQSTMLIMGQQGSQLASGFGAKGALVGAAIAVGAALGGVLLKMGSTSEAAKELKENVDELSGALIELSKADKTTDLDKRLNVAQAKESLKKAKKELKEFSKQLVEAKKKSKEDTFIISGQDTSTIIKKTTLDREKEREGLDLIQKAYNRVSAEIKSYEAIIDGATDESVKADKSLKSKIKALELEIKYFGASKHAIENAKLAQDGANDSDLETLVILQEKLQLLKDKKKAQEEADKKAIADAKLLEAQNKKDEAANKRRLEQNAKLVESLKIKAYAVDRENSEIIKAEKARALNLLTTRGATQAQLDSASASYDAIIASALLTEKLRDEAKAEREKAKAKRDAEKAERKKAKKTDFSKIGTDNLDMQYFLDFMKTKQKAIDDQYDLEKQLAKQARDLGLASEEEYQAKMLELKNEYQKEENTARKRLEDTLTEGGKIAALERQYAQEYDLLKGNLEAQNALTEKFTKDKLKINGTFWQKYAISAEENLGSFDEQVTLSLNNFTSGFGDAIATAAFESDNLGDAMANIFKGVGKNMVAFFAEMAAQKLLYWAFSESVDTAAKTTAATSMTFMAQAASVQAGLNAFASTAMIPVVGAALAPAAAATALAATQPMAGAVSSLAFAGVFDKGGLIPSGSAGIVSEYGDELVGGTMVYNGSQSSLNVTGREQTAKQVGGTNNSIAINSYGEASPKAIARAVERMLKKPNKAVDNSVYDSMNRGRKNRGKRFVT